jgi:hypothetical protein
MKKKKPTRSKPSPPVIWSWIQLKEWTESVDRKLALILDALKDLTGEGEVIPELEQAVKRAAALAKKIDLKVPDEK